MPKDKHGWDSSWFKEFNELNHVKFWDSIPDMTAPIYDDIHEGDDEPNPYNGTYSEE